jgi:hypothetical protein
MEQIMECLLVKMKEIQEFVEAIQEKFKAH